MKAWNVEDVKDMTYKLFVGTVFDHFWVHEVDITTFNGFHIDGRIRKSYFSEEEMAEGGIGELSSWSMLRPVCYTLIKGKRLPGSFHITLQLSTDGTATFLERNHIPSQPGQLPALCLNIRYEEGRLTCITGTSTAAFTLDRTLDRVWEAAVESFLAKSQISCKEL